MPVAALHGEDGFAWEDAIDLDAYFERIGWDGPFDPTLEVLKRVIERHMAAIPFEAIDVMLGRGVDLSPSAMDRKMLAGRRGGYCFEQASLLRRALRAMGFPVEQHLARVRARSGFEGPAPAATHASLKVQADGRVWLADVGFGGSIPNEPLIWQDNVPQETRFGAYRFTRTRDGHVLESWYQEHWSPLYEILDFRWQAADYKVANHYVAHHPDSHFRHDLMVALTARDARYTLAGSRFRIAGVDGSRSEQVLDVQGMADALATRFGLPVPADWWPLLERIVAEDAEAN